MPKDNLIARKTMRLVLLTVLIMAAGGTAVPEATGHESHGRKDSTVVTPSDSRGTAVRTELSEDEGEEFVQPPYVLRPWRALQSHLHNKVVHVPIGFSLGAILLTLLSFRWRDLDRGIRWLVLLAAVGALGAFVTGSNQAAMLEGSSKDWVIDIHRILGIATMSALWLWTAALWILHERRWVALTCGAATALLILVTGFFGGILAYG